MGARTLEELNTYRAARALKLQVYRLVKAHPAAHSDHRFRSQLFEAAASVEMNIAEGFRRYTPGEFAHFVSFASGSLEEVARRIQDGIDRGHFEATDCRLALSLAKECGRLIGALHRHLRRRAHSQKSRR